MEPAPKSPAKTPRFQSSVSDDKLSHRRVLHEPLVTPPFFPITPPPPSETEPIQKNFTISPTSSKTPKFQSFHIALIVGSILLGVFLIILAWVYIFRKVVGRMEGSSTSEGSKSGSSEPGAAENILQKTGQPLNRPAVDQRRAYFDAHRPSPELLPMAALAGKNRGRLPCESSSDEETLFHTATESVGSSAATRRSSSEITSTTPSLTGGRFHCSNGTFSTKTSPETSVSHASSNIMWPTASPTRPASELQFLQYTLLTSKQKETALRGMKRVQSPVPLPSVSPSTSCTLSDAESFNMPPPPPQLPPRHHHRAHKH